MKKRFTEEQIVAILREAESAQRPVGEVCRKHSISAPTFYAWRRKFGPMAESEVRRLKELEKENERLKRLLAKPDLEPDGARERLQKK
jgi:putative transposase